MKYIQFDSPGDIVARFDSEIHGDTVPKIAVKVSDEMFWKTIRETDGVWKLDRSSGKIEKHPFPAPTLEEIELQKVALVQRHLDSKAKEFGYDDMKNAVTYADEPAVSRFQNEGQALRAWRSLVWEKCYLILDEVKSGKRQIPSDMALIKELPEVAL